MLLSLAVLALLGGESKPSLSLKACEQPGLQGKAECGSFEVFEDRVKKGRRIALNVVVLRATKLEKAEGALFFFAGGPGDAATRNAAGLGGYLAPVRERRDLVFVDQRGTGRSHPLECTLFDPAELQSYLGEFLPLPAVKRCRAELSRDADLALYTTSIAAEDVDELRASLGYDKIDLMGGSYGTRAALVYLRQHGDRVRSAYLGGVAPTTDPLPQDFPADAQRALDGVLGECATDASCRGAFPDVKGDARRLFERLAQGAVEVEVAHPATGALVKVRLDHDLAAEAIRYLLYTPAEAGLVPAVVHAGAAGEMTALAEYALFNRRELVGAMGVGMYLSVTCAEDLPFVDPKTAAKAAAGSFLGDYRWRHQRAACEAWVRGGLPEGYRQPVTSDVPVLLVSGQWDPATPPAAGDAVAKHLPNSLHVVVPHGAHGLDGLVGGDCIDKLTLAFFDKGTTKGLETACVAKVARAPFPTSLPPLKAVALPEADLKALAGRYKAEGPPIEATLSLEGGRLKIAAMGREFALVPVAKDRLRVPGSLGLYFLVERDGARVKRLSLEEGGQVSLSFVPAP